MGGHEVLLLEQLLGEEEPGGVGFSGELACLGETWSSGRSPGLRLWEAPRQAEGSVYWRWCGCRGESCELTSAHTGSHSTSSLEQNPQVPPLLPPVAARC